MTKLFSNYSRSSINLVGGEGAVVVDSEGKCYLDFTSGIGVANLGYHHESVYQAVSEQLKGLWHVPNLYVSPLQEEVAEKLIGNRPYLAFFCNSGTEANEAAIKLARKATGKPEIITFIDSFHGRTYGGMSATGQEIIHEGFGPLVPGFVYCPYNDYDALVNLVTPETGAIMLEVIQGEGGVVPADIDWLQKVSALCQGKNILLIVDEVQTGIGRTGNLYGYEAYSIEPDIITLAKGLGNGIPVGAMLGKKELGNAFGPGSHGSTFGGNNLAMVAASEVLSQVDQRDFLEEVKSKGNYLQEQLKEKLVQIEEVVEIRGIGLMIGIELNVDPVPYIKELASQGMLVLKAGKKVIRLLPSLIVTHEQIDEAVNKITSVLKK